MFFDTKSRPNKLKISICLIIMQFFDRFCGFIRGNDFFFLLLPIFYTYFRSPPHNNLNGCRKQSLSSRLPFLTPLVYDRSRFSPAILVFCAELWQNLPVLIHTDAAESIVYSRDGRIDLCNE